MSVLDAFKTVDDDMVEIDTSFLKTREDYNHAICLVITKIIETYPDWRFHQVLINCGVTLQEDLFYEEGRATLVRMLENNVVSRFFRFKKQEGKIIEFGTHNK